MASAPVPPGPEEETDLLGEFLDAPQTSKLAKKQIFAFLKDRSETYDTSENYSQDVARRIDKIRDIQQDMRRHKPGVTLNPIQVAFLLQMDYATLDTASLVGMVEMLDHAEPFVKCCKSMPS
jgi:hypothetical protein